MRNGQSLLMADSGLGPAEPLAANDTAVEPFVRTSMEVGAQGDPDQNKTLSNALGHLERGAIEAAREVLKHGPDLLEGRVSAFVERLAQGEAMVAAIGVAPDAVPGPPVGPRNIGNVEGLAIAPCAGAKRVVITFGGNTRQFVLPLPLVVLADTHVVMVRDRTRCFTVAGVPRLGATYGECLANLKRIAAELGADEIYCLGVSSGGYGAFKYALDLGARGVYGFSTPTTLDLSDDPGATLEKYPALSALYRRSPELAQDMAKLYRQAKRRPEAVLVFSRQHPRDTWLAERMLGIPGVDVVETSDEAGHKTFQWYCANQLIGGAIDRLLTLKPVK